MQAGTARADITPSRPVWMDGMIRAHRSRGVHDPLFARALVLGDSPPAGLWAVVSVDVCALRPEDCRRAREEASRRTGIPVSQIIIAATHNHSGPATMGYFNAAEPEYTAELLETLADLVLQAASALRPALAGCGSGREETVSHYRRLLGRDGHVVMNWEPVPAGDIVGPLGEPDPEVGVLRVVEAKAGERPLCLLFNHAGHPNVMSGENLLLSADYPGAACRHLEQEWGGLAMFVNGAQGSVDIDGLRHRDWEGVERAGEALARAVSEAAAGISLARPTSPPHPRSASREGGQEGEGGKRCTPGPAAFQIPDSRFQMRAEGERGERDSSASARPRRPGRPAVGMTQGGSRGETTEAGGDPLTPALSRGERAICGSSHTISIPARTITEAEWDWAEQVLARTGGRVEPLADGVGDDYKAVLYRRLRERSGQPVTVEQACFAIGDTAFLTVPCELYTEIGLRLKAESPFPRTLILGLANGNLGYVPTRKAIAEGGYAEDTRQLDDAAEGLLAAASRDLLRRVHAETKE